MVFARVAYIDWHMIEDSNALHQKALLIEMVNRESRHLHELEMNLVHTVTFLIIPFSNPEGVILMRKINNIVDKASHSISTQYYKLDQNVDKTMRMISIMCMDTWNNLPS